MKRPFSPSSPPSTTLHSGDLSPRPGLPMDSDLCCDAQDEVTMTEAQSKGGNDCSALFRPKRERKQRSYTLCDVCNIQLNSAAQAQIHYNGKSHQKRLKQTNKGKTQSNTGTSAQVSPLLASLPLPGRPLQPQLDLKHLLPFRLNGSSPLSLFPNFNTVSQMDPVQKAVINHTFGVPQPLKKKQIISCNICHLRFNSMNQAEAHYKGHKHARKLKAMEAQKNRQRRSGEGSTTGRERDRDRERERDRERDRSKTSVSEATIPALMDTSMEEGENLQLDTEPVRMEEKLVESPSSSVMLTPESEISSVELVTLSPAQVSPSSQLSETASDTSNLEIPEASEATAPSTVSGSCADTSSPNEETCTDEDKEPKKSKAHLHCSVCRVTVNSVSQLEAHNSGTKHKLMLEGHSVLPRRRGKLVTTRSGCKSKRLGSKGTVGVPSKNFHCEVCEIYVNSETQLSQHMNSRRHKDRLAGKPPKPKFTPHSKSPPSSILANVKWSGYAGMAMSGMKKAFSQYNLTSLSSQTKLALQKQLTKSLTTGFLPSPLTQPTLCTMATNPLALRHPVGTTTFIQTPFLGPALFRPAPGPLRATHTPIIFSPY
ncbi:zinc finger protein 385C isoform X2 [Gouania willdenowi]|uniref:zinc finger protein 385C isoform X2 n=1 Tax=Gouania willdenowi TaxID=441366 RepID=UPI001056269C|nr:zinc finger protein 385C isoform X2 [Gouania willdenowi]